MQAMSYLGIRGTLARRLHSAFDSSAATHRCCHGHPVQKRLYASTNSKYLPNNYITSSSSDPHPYATFYPTLGTPSPLVHSFFDNATSTWTYLVVDPETYQALVIDPVLDFDPVSGDVQTRSVKELLGFIKQSEYRIRGIVETHVHADHLSGAYALRIKTGGTIPISIGERVTEVQKTFAKAYGYEAKDFDGMFDSFLEDEGEFMLGSLRVKTFPLPGHTPDSMGLLIGDSLFAGDSIFLPDVGSARVDFPGGSADALYQSVQRVLNLPPSTRVFSGHDYPVGREKSCMALVSEHIANNRHLGHQTSLQEFVKMREERDAVLGTPRLLHAALQFNLRGGRVPPVDEEGRSYIRIPLKGETVLLT